LRRFSGVSRLRLRADHDRSLRLASDRQHVRHSQDVHVQHARVHEQTDGQLAERAGRVQPVHQRKRRLLRLREGPERPVQSPERVLPERDELHESRGQHAKLVFQRHDHALGVPADAVDVGRKTPNPYRNRSGFSFFFFFGHKIILGCFRFRFFFFFSLWVTDFVLL